MKRSSARYRFGPAAALAGLIALGVWAVASQLPPNRAGDPPLRPGTAIATFQPDANGELRYPETDKDANGRRTRRHAGVFLEYGEQNGRPGIFVLDQFHGRGPVDDGRAMVRFLPFERAPGRSGYIAGEFRAIRPAASPGQRP